MRMPTRLESRNVSGAGMEIHGHFLDELQFPEFKMKAGPQRIVIGTEPWIQFPKQDWDDVISTVFQQMVDLWNKEYGITNE